MKKFNIAIVGLGGQGIITMGTVMKNAALNSDLQDVSGSERRGGAQREGYVETFVKYIFYENAAEMNNPRKNIAFADDRIRRRKCFNIFRAVRNFERHKIFKQKIR
jgi:Pyruvate:ferredoxin oxidoreductase and related 2-oxoacid:ferredoxin oxidoreductases, gamma subunit